MARRLRGGSCTPNLRVRAALDAESSGAAPGLRPGDGGANALRTCEAPSKGRRWGKRAPNMRRSGEPTFKELIQAGHEAALMPGMVSVVRAFAAIQTDYPQLTLERFRRLLSAYGCLDRSVFVLPTTDKGARSEHASCITRKGVCA